MTILTYRLLPFLKWKHLITRQNMQSDLIAGLTGALIVLPQAIAFASIAGLPVEYGIYSAIIPSIIAGLFGSSLHLVSGPATAISMVIFASITQFVSPSSTEYIEYVLTLTFMVGIFQLLLGLFRMGVLVNFISDSVIIGFTMGTSCLIIASQLKHFFGIKIPSDADFIRTIAIFLGHLDEINLYAFMVGISTLISVILIKKIFPKLPNIIIAMFIGSSIAYWINLNLDQPMVRILGDFNIGFSPFSFNQLNFSRLQDLFPVAFALALLALTQAISISRSIAVQSGQQLDNNQEFIGQGLSNIVASIFSGYVSSGSFNRSGLNYTSGAKTPLSAIFSAILLQIIVLFIAPLIAFLPYPVMGGVLFVVAYNLIEPKKIKQVFKTSQSDSITLIVTFLATLLIRIEFAIYVGIMLSLILFLSKNARPIIRSMIPNASDPLRKFIPAKSKEECPQLALLRIEGAMFFGATQHIKQTFLNVDADEPNRKFVVVIGKGINFIDVAGADLLLQESIRRKQIGGELYLYSLRESVYETLNKGEYLNKIGKEYISNSKGELIRKIYPKMNHKICEQCKAKIFQECPREFYYDI